MKQAEKKNNKETQLDYNTKESNLFGPALMVYKYIKHINLFKLGAPDEAMANRNISAK